MNRKWTLLVAALLSATAIVANAAGTSISKQVPIGTQNRVTISNVAGSVSITAWDRKEVDVQGELGDGVDQVDVRQDSGIIDIKVELKDNGWSEGSFRNGGAKLQIKVPADAQIDASTISASISANGLRGRQRLKTVSGDIRSDVAGSELDLKSVSGRIDLVGNGNTARVRATSVSGTVTLSHVGGDIEAHSTSGDVDIDSQGASAVRASVVSGDISLQGALAREADVDASSMSGRVKVAAQFPGGFNYDATTFSGNIRNCLGVEVDRGDRRRGFGGNRLSGSRGEGKATVRARSHSGSVELCDH
jgi:DUF4097 and DUF4098 domain-containing protein YvlB